MGYLGQVQVFSRKKAKNSIKTARGIKDEQKASTDTQVTYLRDNAATF